MEKYTYSPGVDAPPTGAIAKLTVGTILKAMYLRKAFEKKKKEPYFCGDLGFCVFFVYGIGVCFWRFSNLLFFFAENPRVDFCNLAIWPGAPGNPRYGSAAEFAKIIDGVTEAEVPAIRRRRRTFPRRV